MLRSLTVDDLAGGIQLVDVGASGRPDPKWQPLAHLINLVGFEPNADECARLQARKHPFRSATFLPYAVSGENAEATLYKTKSIYCYSLLEPNTDWLRRFAFQDLFQVTGQESIRTHRFQDIPELTNVDADVIKLDSQGLELPILESAGELLDRAFYVETETGFVENYSSETTYAQIDGFMRGQGFLLFDLNLQHRVPRGNALGQHSTGKEQILWCEAIWLRDYLAPNCNARAFQLSREKALRVLLLCALQGCVDFGYELARFFAERGALSSTELETLGNRQAWQLAAPPLSRQALRLCGAVTRILPRRVRRTLVTELERNIERPSAWRSLFGSRRARQVA